MSAIQCNALSKRYGGTTALDNLDLELPEGPPIALIGPNGAGKTTLISLLCGFIKPSGGQFSVLGHAPGSADLSGKLAALPQDAVLDPRLSVGRQLKLLARLQGLSSKIAVDEVDRVLSIVDLTDSASSKPQDLSHGMRKRIAIAQSLIGNPQLVLLDEPTAGIDPPNAKMIRDLIREQSSSTTFIVSSHNLDELERLCDSVVYLEKGRLIEYAPITDDIKHDVLTLRMANVDENLLLNAIGALPEVHDVRRGAQGDYIIQTDNDLKASVHIMQLLESEGWRYRQLTRGRSLEERLYGESV